jgi:hypothetical protein
MKLRTPLLAILFVLSFAFSVHVNAFQREHLTEQEIDKVKEAQELDKRIDVFIKAAERRLIALGAATADAKQSKKDAESWGELPTGSRAELISDIAKIFDEAITNIDDVSARDENNPLIPKALRKLAAEATRVVDQLKPVQATAKGDAEINSFDQLTENAQAIVDAANRLPPPVEKKGKSKTEKTKATND